MSHFVTWFLMSAGGVFSAWVGINTWSTAADCAYFSATALLVHWLYEGKA